MIDGDLLTSFAAFAETRNLTRAARAVGVSQPALFERLRRLAEATGQALYERQGRELVLTEAGSRVLAFAREQASRHAELLAELSGAVPPRQVVLAAGEGSYLYLLGPALRSCTSDPELDLQLLTLGAPATLEALRAGRAHLGVAVTDLIPRGIDAEPLLTTSLCVALPRRHPAVRARKLELADLRAERWILPPKGQLHRELVSRAVARSGDAPAAVTDADGWPLMLSFVASGVGIAIVNGTCAAPSGVVLRPLPELGTVTYRLLTRRGAPRSNELAAVAAAIRSCCAARR